MKNHRTPSPRTIGAILLSLVAAILLTPVSASASNREPKTATVRTQKAKSEKDGKTVITGSKVPRKPRSERILTTAAPVVVITQQDIERSGRITVAGLLASHPSFR